MWPGQITNTKNYGRDSVSAFEFAPPPTMGTNHFRIQRTPVVISEPGHDCAPDAGRLSDLRIIPQQQPSRDIVPVTNPKPPDMAGPCEPPASCRSLRLQQGLACDGFPPPFLLSRQACTYSRDLYRDLIKNASLCLPRIALTDSASRNCFAAPILSVHLRNIVW